MTIKDKLDRLALLYLQSEQFRNEHENGGYDGFIYCVPFRDGVQLVDCIDKAAEAVGQTIRKLPVDSWVNDDGEIECGIRTEGFTYRGVLFYQLIHEREDA